MKKLNLLTKIVLIFLAVILVVIICGALFFYIVFPPPLSPKAMEKDFRKNQSDIILVMSYLAASEYTDIYITSNKPSGVMFVSTVGDVEIGNVEVTAAIDTLLRKGYKVIIRDKNTVSFQRSATLDYGSGVAYSIDGSEPQLQFLTKLQPLPEQNWYYYEEDFNKWKAQSKEQD